jgi:hypothetical protein
VAENATPRSCVKRSGARANGSIPTPRACRRPRPRTPSASCARPTAPCWIPSGVPPTTPAWRRPGRQLAGFRASRPSARPTRPPGLGPRPGVPPPRRAPRCGLLRRSVRPRPPIGAAAPPARLRPRGPIRPPGLPAPALVRPRRRPAPARAGWVGRTAVSGYRLGQSWFGQQRQPAQARLGAAHPLRWRVVCPAVAGVGPGVLPGAGGGVGLAAGDGTGAGTELVGRRRAGGAASTGWASRPAPRASAP